MNVRAIRRSSDKVLQGSMRGSHMWPRSNNDGPRVHCSSNTALANLRSLIGSVTQETASFGNTVRNNVGLSPRTARAELQGVPT